MKWELWDIDSEAVVKALLDKDIIQLHYMARGKMSYYNAAEGSSWYKEADARSECQKRLDWLSAELRARDLKPKKGNFLN